MNVAINAQLLNTGDTYRSGGVSKYSENLLRYMDRADHANLHIHAHINDPQFTLQNIDLQRTRLPLHNPLARIAWEQIALPLQLRQQRADLVHGLVNILPLPSPIPSVVTVHDLSFLRMPQMLPRFKAAYLARLCRASVNKANRVIAVSQQTADDLLHFFDCSVAKIDVIYNGIGEQFVPAQQRATPVQDDLISRELPDKFILYLGTLEPRKNLEVLIRGYAEWRAQSDADPEIKLVLAGAKGWFYEQIFERVRELHLTDHVIFAGYVPDKDLPRWYQAATCFVYPSLFEGFGIPVAEAMACGTPVLVSQAQSLLEVIGDAGISFETENAEDLAQKLGMLLADPHLRSEVAEKCLARAIQFTWSRAAEETLSVYKHILG